MDYETFTRAVAQRAGLPEDTTERIGQATLRALADRISGGEAQDLASQLPTRLKDALRPAHEEARRGAPAVLTTVRDAVTPGEFEDVISQLPMEYRALAGATS